MLFVEETLEKLTLFFVTLKCFQTNNRLLNVMMLSETLVMKLC